MVVVKLWEGKSRCRRRALSIHPERWHLLSRNGATRERPTRGIRLYAGFVVGEHPQC